MEKRRIDHRLLEMIQRHLPSLPMDDRYTDWSNWLRFANAVRTDALNEIASELEQHNSHWEAWYLKQRAAGEMPTFDEAVTPSNVKWTAYAPPILSLRRPFWIERWDQGIAGIEQILVSDASSPG